MKTIDITPTWQGLMPALIRVLQNPRASADAHKQCEEELMRLAKFADDHNAKNKGAK